MSESLLDQRRKEGGLRLEIAGIGNKRCAIGFSGDDRVGDLFRFENERWLHTASLICAADREGAVFLEHPFLQEGFIGNAAGRQESDAQETNPEAGMEWQLHFMILWLGS